MDGYTDFHDVYTSRSVRISLAVNPEVLTDKEGYGMRLVVKLEVNRHYHIGYAVCWANDADYLATAMLQTVHRAVKEEWAMMQQCEYINDGQRNFLRDMGMPKVGDADIARAYANAFSMGTLFPPKV